MAQAFGIIDQQLATTSLADMYVVPALTQVVISSISVCNFSGAPSTFTIKIAKAGAANSDSQWLYAVVPIPEAETFIATVGITLEATDVVRIQAGDATAVTVQLFGSIIT